MSIFTPSIYNEPSFSGLFRLLDDFDNYRASTSSASQHHNNNHQQITSNNANQQRQLATGRGGSGVGLLGQQMSFAPKFDLRETDTAFELRGDLPGVDRSQVHVEFADENTLTVRGRVEREWSSGSNNNNNDASKKSADEAVGEAGEEKQNDNSNTATTTAAAAAASKDGGSVQQQQPQKQTQTQTQTQAKYWITERSVGEFSRSFRLTGHHQHSAQGGDVELDHDGVTARLDNGVLSVVVPKVVREKKRQAARKVQIN